MEHLPENLAEWFKQQTKEFKAILDKMPTPEDVAKVAAAAEAKQLTLFVDLKQFNKSLQDFKAAATEQGMLKRKIWFHHKETSCESLNRAGTLKQWWDTRPISCFPHGGAPAVPQFFYHYRWGLTTQVLMVFSANERN